MNMENLARALEGDAQLDEKKGNINLNYWRPHVSSNNPYFSTYRTPCPSSSKTRLVAFKTCSNILVPIVQIKDLIKAVRAKATKQGVRTTQVALSVPMHRVGGSPCRTGTLISITLNNSALCTRAAFLHSSLSPPTYHFLSAAVSYNHNYGGPGYEKVNAVTGPRCMKVVKSEEGGLSRKLGDRLSGSTSSPMRAKSIPWTLSAFFPGRAHRANRRSRTLMSLKAIADEQAEDDLTLRTVATTLTTKSLYRRQSVIAEDYENEGVDEGEDEGREAAKRSDVVEELTTPLYAY
ncbi:hypothetical protein FA95DRAFT_1578844 [Auriscalpium vulgare]|uniref:Uncharacterized protein n=1 Tax=Auriscalpium vulgare TaxID=40419 RepID=A0ACB8QZX9_9AGAM|nr:hypothetical protein FA95DRAFT_1578844 [Auriscalpium vulgare]